MKRKLVLLFIVAIMLVTLGTQAFARDCSRCGNPCDSYHITIDRSGYCLDSYCTVIETEHYNVYGCPACGLAEEEYTGYEIYHSGGDNCPGWYYNFCSYCSGY